MKEQTCREKFLGTMSFKNVAPPNWEFAYWYDTVERWYREGLPRVKGTSTFPNSQWVSGEACPNLDENYLDFAYGADIRDYFGFDHKVRLVPVDFERAMPPFTTKVISETSDKIIRVCEDGKTIETRKDGTSIPRFIDYPVKNKEDFINIKERYRADMNSRFPANFEEQAKEYADRDYPLQMGGGVISGFFSVVREMVGVERAMYMFYDEPDFVIDILEFFYGYYMSAYTSILKVTDVDYILIWEDMCYKNGPLISPDMFREFIQPFYIRLIAEMKKAGVKNFMVDTDGNALALLPLFIESGVNAIYPFEAAAGMDVSEIRSEFSDLVIMGGIDKRALAYGPEAIDTELKKAAKVLKTGGYIPYTDHMVPPDVSFENYCYYRNELSKLIG